MTGTSIHDIALHALRTRTLIRLGFEGGDASLIRAGPAALDRVPKVSDSVTRLVDELWKKKGGGKYDGALMGVDGADVSSDAVTLACRAIRYRDYIATDRVLEVYPRAQVPLAVGVHAVLVAEDGVVCLRLQNGRIALPGGAVDAADLRRGCGDAVVRGLVREVAEETGIDLVGHPIEATGIYIGGYPTHILVMLSADLRGEVGQAICAFSPVDAHDQVHSIELHTFSNLLDQTWELPLVVRAALQSLLHRRGAEPAWTIPT